jgi:hypothetical protein
MTAPKHRDSAALKARAIEELRLYWIITLYTWVMLGSFTVYRRLVLAEVGIAYLHYGFALVEAMVIGKVVLIGRLFGFSRRFDNKPLIVPVLFKTLLVGALVFAFGIVERIVEGWFHHEGPFGGLRKIGELGLDEIGARALMLIVAFIPFFAFWELGRVLGPRTLSAHFLSRRATD